MKTLPAVALSALAVGVGGLGFLVALSGPGERSKETVLVESESGDSGDTVARENAELRGQLARLSRRVLQLEDGDEVMPDAASEDTSQDEFNDEPDPEAEQAEAEAERFLAQERTKDYDATIEAETRDPEWAGEMETHIDQVFGEPIEGTHLVSSDCRATHCRIEVEHDSRARGQMFAARWNEIPGSKLVQEMEESEDGRARTLAYLVKAGEEENSPVFSQILVRN